MIPRFDVPWQFLERRPNLEEWDRYLLLLAKNTPMEPVKYFSNFGGAGALLTSRLLWKALRGFDERNSGWGWADNEFGIRVSQNYPWLSLSAFGVFLYHMEHTPHAGRRASVFSKPTNPHHFNTLLDVNSDDWGLGGYDLEIQVPQIRCAYEVSVGNVMQCEPDAKRSLAAIL